MYSVFTLGVAFWLVYGIVTKAAPIIAANAVTLALAATILGLTAKDRFNQRRPARALQLDAPECGSATPAHADKA